MNVDFTLPATGAVARRLMVIASNYKLDLDPAIISMAKTDLVRNFGDELQPFNSVRQTAIQFIVDCGLRCVLGYSGTIVTPGAILDAVATTGETILTIVVHNGAKWREALRGFACFSDVKIMKLDRAFLMEEQAGRRGGTLIIADGECETGKTQAIAKEFPKTIIYQEQPSPDLNYTIALGALLFLELPKVIPEVLTEPDDVKHKKAIFYNVFFPELAEKPGYL